MTPAVDPARESETLHIARQPILDERGRVFGYELLYRHAAHDVTCTADGTCTVKDSSVVWQTRIESDGDTAYVVEGFAAYGDALSALADLPVLMAQ